MALIRTVRLDCCVKRLVVFESVVGTGLYREKDQMKVQEEDLLHIVTSLPAEIFNRIISVGLTFIRCMKCV